MLQGLGQLLPHHGVVCLFGVIRKIQKVIGNIVALTNGRSASAIETGWVALVTDQAQRVSSAKLLQETTQARSDAASEARDNASGVDLDQEAVDLLRYQQSFDAAARVIQTAREILQTILNIAR